MKTHKNVERTEIHVRIDQKLASQIYRLAQKKQNSGAWLLTPLIERGLRLLLKAEAVRKS